MRGAGRLTRVFMAAWAAVAFASAPALPQAAADTARKAETRWPTGAMLRSALIPGWGQVYADQPLRAIAAFGAVAGTAGSVVYYNQLVVKSRSREERDFYMNYRSQMAWWCAAAYFLNLLDAYVDAHLWHFDTGPGLSENTPVRTARFARVGLAWRL
jgi:hypothetical protein